MALPMTSKVPPRHDGSITRLNPPKSTPASHQQYRTLENPGYPIPAYISKLTLIPS